MPGQPSTDAAQCQYGFTRSECTRAVHIRVGRRSHDGTEGSREFCKPHAQMVTQLAEFDLLEGAIAAYWAELIPKEI